MLNKELDIYCACISTNRPKNISEIKRLTGIDFTYYTRAGETTTYKNAGAHNVVEVNANIVVARNQAIKDANGKICLQISDDLRKVNIISGVKGNYKRVPISFIDALKIMVERFIKYDCDYAGTAITDSPIQYQNKPIEINKLIVNDCILLGGKMLFDEKADLKEDYDMFITQVRAGNKVLRFSAIAMTFPHRDNAGGANDYRTTEREKKCNEYVMLKHKGIIEHHSKRENQLKINYKKLYE
jgi:hypothetical protein